MGTPRKRITFPTPSRKIKKTPNKKQNEKSKIEENNPSSKKEYSKNDKSINKVTRNENTETEENDYESQDNNSSVDDLIERTREEKNNNTVNKDKKRINTRREIENQGSKVNKNKKKGNNNLYEMIGKLENVDSDKYLGLIIESRKAEKALIQKYKEEIEFIRNIKNDILPYTKFLGLQIETVENDTYNFIWKIEDKGVKKKIQFKLTEDESGYNYEYIDSKNVMVSDIFLGCLSFDKNQIYKFFANYFEFLITKAE